MRLVTAAQMRALDERTIRELGIPGAALMETAGRGAADLIERLLDERPPEAGEVVVVCGPGNNGGDGFVCARTLHGRGRKVRVILVADEGRVRGDALLHLSALRRLGGRIEAGDHADAPDARLADAAVVVDALLGTGAARPLDGAMASWVEAINRSSAIRVALDAPTGLDVDRGTSAGACVRADHTVTFGLAKLGLASSPGHLLAGRLHVVDIGIPRAWTDDVRAVLLEADVVAPLASPRDPLAHKGRFGHLLVVAGSPEHPGAARLCSEAAARAGAGLVTLAVDAATAPAVAAGVREASLARFEGTGERADPRPLLVGKSAVVMGPGLGQDHGALARLRELLSAWSGPLVLDADALNLMASLPEHWIARVGPTVITPHPAEMGRLLGLPTAAVQADRNGHALALARDRDTVVVLKGARTVVAAPDGRLALNPTGGPALAAGGTGDVLAGVIGALLAQHDLFPGPWEAACAGVYWHGLSGDAATALRGDAGVLASDVIDELPRVRRGLGATTGRRTGPPSR